MPSKAKLTRSILEALADITDNDIARQWTNLNANQRSRIFSLAVRGDIKQILLEKDPHIKSGALGNQMDLAIQADIGDGAMAFTFLNTDIPDGVIPRQMTRSEVEQLSKQRLARAVSILQSELGLAVIQREYVRRITAKRDEVQQGAVTLKHRVYCADLLHGYNSPYRGRDEMIGYSFEVQISVSKTTLWIQVRFSEKLPRNL